MNQADENRRPANAPHRVLFCPWTDDNAYCRIIAQVLEPHGFVVQPERGRYYRGIGTFQLFRQRRSYSILHLHWLHPLLKGRNFGVTALRLAAFLCKLLVLRLRGKKIIWTIHNQRAHEDSSATIDWCAGRVTALLAHACIVHSQSARDAVSRYLMINPDKLSVIPHPEYSAFYQARGPLADMRPRFSIGREKLLFLLIGQVRPYKGHIELMRAFQSSSDPSAQLLICGRSKHEDYAAQLRKLQARDDRVRCVFSHVPDELVASVINSSDVVLLPYRDVITSGTAVLAMSYGKPCIAPDTPYFRELFGDEGAFLYSLDDEDGLRRCLDEACASRSRLQAMGDRNRSVAKNWTAEKVGSLLAEVFTSVLQPPYASKTAKASLPLPDSRH